MQIFGTKYDAENAALAELDSYTAPAVLAGEPWPEPEALGGKLPSVLPLEADMLPASLAPLVMDVAERMHVPMDLPGVALVAMFAGAVGRRAVIQPQRHDTTWQVVPNLWGGIIAPPSSMKSAVINAIAAPLREIEREWAVEDEREQKLYEATLEESKLQKQAWEKDAEKAYAAKREPPPRPLEPDAPPASRRLITQDATREKLHALNQANPGGILVLLDELTGFFVGLEDSKRRGERQYFLTAWNGDQPFTMDRVTRGTLRVDHTCLSLFGGIQPAPLAQYTLGALSDCGSDGLMQRFQLLTWPDPLPNAWTNVDRAPDTLAQDRVRGIFRRLTHMDTSEPKRYRFDPQAQALFVQWRTDLERRLRLSDDSEAILVHLSKYRSLMPSLALLFWLADDGADEAVPLAHAQLAADWCDYLESHARRVYSTRRSSEQRGARSLGDLILEGKLGKSFTIRDAYRPQRSGLTNKDEARAAIRHLEDLDWLREMKTGGKTKPHSPRYAVSPLLEAHHAGL